MFNSFPVYREIKNHWIFENPNHLKIWIYILGETSYSKEEKVKPYNGILYTYRYGEFIFGRKHWSEVLMLGEGTIRGCFKLLLETDMIRLVEQKTKYTIYSVTNYEKYNQQDNHLLELENKGLSKIVEPPEKPAANHQLTTSEPQYKKVKKVKTNTIVEYSTDFIEFWELYPRCSNKKQTFTNYKNCLLEEEVTPAIILFATKNYLKNIETNNTEPNFIINSTNFVGTAERYKEWLAVKKVIKRGEKV